jgi:hypothetical protein
MLVWRMPGGGVKKRMKIIYAHHQEPTYQNDAGCDVLTGLKK